MVTSVFAMPEDYIDSVIVELTNTVKVLTQENARLMNEIDIYIYRRNQETMVCLLDDCDNRYPCKERK